MAQSQVSGVVHDKITAKPMQGATVNLLFQRDSVAQNTVVTDNNGRFTFSNVPADSFIVTVNFMDYQQYVNFFKLTGADRNLGTLEMVRQGKDLAGVTIVARAPIVVQRGDTSQYSASQFKVNPDATTEDLLKKMPGITVGRDGTVTAQEKP